MIDRLVINYETEVTFIRQLKLYSYVNEYNLVGGDVIAETIPNQTKGIIISSLFGTHPHKHLIEVPLSQNDRAYVWAHDYEIE